MASGDAAGALNTTTPVCIVNNLINCGQSRPRKLQSLKNTIGNFVSDELSDAERQALVNEIQKASY